MDLPGGYAKISLSLVNNPPKSSICEKYGDYKHSKLFHIHIRNKPNLVITKIQKPYKTSILLELQYKHILI